MNKGRSKAMTTPSSKVSGHLLALDKLNTSCSDDVEQYRYLTCRVLTCMREQEKYCKEVASSPYEGIDILLATLESSTDSIALLNVTFCLLEILNLERKISVFVARGATQVTVATLGVVFKDQPVCEQLMKSLHHLLGKIGGKDKKFGIKARLGGSLPITLSLIRTNSGNFEYLLPLLQVLKLYCSNAVNSSNLGKSGAVNTMLRIVATCGKKHHTICKLAIDCLFLLTKSKSNAARALGQGGISVLLSLFYEWHRHDVRNRHVGIRKAILGVIKNLTSLKSGRKAFIEADGIKILYGIILDMPSSSSKEIDGIISLISIILRKCFPKNRLPVPTIKSCFLYPIPDSNGEQSKPNMGEGVDDVIDVSDDGDDDISSTEEDHVNKEEEHDLEDGDEEDHGQARSCQDLIMYQAFFKELTDFEELLKDCCDSEEDGSEGYVMSNARKNNPRDSQTSPLPQTNLKENRLSLPNLTIYTNAASRGEDGRSTESDGQVQTIKRRVGSRSSRKQASSKLKESSSASHKISGRKHSSSRPTAKGSKSFPSVRVSSTPSKGEGQLSKSLTSLRNLDQVRPFVGVRTSEQYFDNLDMLRSSISVSQMTLQSQSQADNNTEHVYPDVESIPAEVYMKMLKKTRRVQPFHWIAYPDMLGHVSPNWKEVLYERPPKAQRALMFQDIDRCIRVDSVSERVIYDLDSLLNREETTLESTPAFPSQNGLFKFSNSDRDSDGPLNFHSLFESGNLRKLKKKHQNGLTEWNNHWSWWIMHILKIARFKFSKSDRDSDGPLNFHSLFESGNLRKAIQVRKHEYDLILNSDINSNHHHQWFYFAISNMKSGISYRFNIVNCEKINSQFNFGMQPVIYSVKDAMEGHPQWVRSGHDVCYYKNNYARSFAASGSKGKSYYTSAFKIVFPHDNDTVYMAYHYPYTYTTLQVHLSKLEASLGEFSQIYYRKETFCETLSGNPCQLLTITSNPLSYDSEGVMQFRCRQFIFLSARVHPGETNSSWVMKGVLRFLLSQHPSAQQLRDTFIFKIVPMLNADGVINGSHRCSLTGEDLNRKWACPDPKRHPTIYHTKGLLQFTAMINRRPLVFCDFHGHSRKKNVFLYGCSAGMSYAPEDLDKHSLTNKDGHKVEDTSYKTLPRILSRLAPAFSLNNCNFVVEKSKDATARVVVWRELGVARSYTMESTYSGLDQGPYKGCQVTTEMLEEMGYKFCEGLLKLSSKTPTNISSVIRMPSVRNADGEKENEENVKLRLENMTSLSPEEESRVFQLGGEDNSGSDVDQDDAESNSSQHDGLDDNIEQSVTDGAHSPSRSSQFDSSIS